jgi:hypothetical protein
MSPGGATDDAHPPRQPAAINPATPSPPRTRHVRRQLDEVGVGEVVELKSRVNGFAWQQKYGAFSVSQSGVPRVVRYIQGQEAHRRKQTFEEGLRELLEKHGIDFDPRYLWT